jgi:uncharacterized protein (DUF362 family)
MAMAMVGPGPLGGHAVETGLVIAGTDALAADVVGARLLGFGVMSLQQSIEAFTAVYGRRLTFEHA